MWWQRAHWKGLHMKWFELGLVVLTFATGLIWGAAITAA